MLPAAWFVYVNRSEPSLRVPVDRYKLSYFVSNGSLVIHTALNEDFDESANALTDLRPHIRMYIFNFDVYFSKKIHILASH